MKNIDFVNAEIHKHASIFQEIMLCCQKLGAQPIDFNKKIPSQEDLENFEAYLKAQEQEKVRASVP